MTCLDPWIETTELMDFIHDQKTTVETRQVSQTLLFMALHFDVTWSAILHRWIPMWNPLLSSEFIGIAEIRYTLANWGLKSSFSYWGGSTWNLLKLDSELNNRVLPNQAIFQDVWSCSNINLDIPDFSKFLPAWQQITQGLSTARLCHSNHILCQKMMESHEYVGITHHSHISQLHLQPLVHDMCEMLDPSTRSPPAAPLLTVHEHRPCVGLDWCRCPCSKALIGFTSLVVYKLSPLYRNDLTPWKFNIAPENKPSQKDRKSTCWCRAHCTHLSTV